MSTKIGHFEILSELAKSATATVYKANDSQTSQTVALKAIQLCVFGESAGELVKCLTDEAAACKVLSHSNLAPVYSAGEIDGQFYAAMEYVQGNSIATMLARKEGFSIWDLLDIGRQVCSGLDHAQSHNVFHCSLEPAKIMCGWDGTVRILSYGVSSVGKFTRNMPGLPAILHYMSPEQVRGENLDERSNLFSLGAMFYEMVTERKAFDGEDAEFLRRSVVEGIPVAPQLVNPKVHPILSDLIMKALAKDPAQRYQTGRELLDDLEKCKESRPQAKASAAPAKSSVVIPDTVKAANQAKFIASAQSAPPKPASVPAAANRPAVKVPNPAVNKAAAAAGSSGGPAISSAPVKPTIQSTRPPSASMSSSAIDEPAIDPTPPQTPRIAVDPMMAEDAPARAGGGVSFSEMTELPPLKEAYIAPAPPPPPPVHERQVAQAPGFTVHEPEPGKPKVKPREVADKAMKEIKNVPPRLMVYSVAGAAILILIIAVGLFLHVNNLNNDGDTPRPAAAAPQPAASQPPAQTESAQPQTVAPEADAQGSAPEAVESAPEPDHGTAIGSRASRKRAAAVAAAPGQMAIDSTPQGVQVQIDGKTDPSWVTPVTLSGLAAGRHSVTFSKPGYSSDTRTVDVASGGKSMMMTRLAQILATLAVSSSPAGANVYIDGKNTGKLTPAQVSVEKGQHVVLVRKAGYIDETTNAQFILGQTINFSPALRPLGNVDDIRTVGKMKKLFGGKETQGMGTVSVKTQPKGAQIAVNQHMVDKDSPVEFLLDPGNYIVDITMSGYAPIHKVITVDRGAKTVIDEALRPE